MTLQADDSELTQVKHVEQISYSPSVWISRDFLTDDECDHLMEIARDKLMRSYATHKETGKSVIIPERTSSQTFISRGHDPVVSIIEKRLSNLMKMPVEHGEPLQILRYQLGEEYKQHHDYYDPNLPGEKLILEHSGQRVATILMYLTDVEEGGETLFPAVNLRVEPSKRFAVMFFNVYSEGQIDPKSSHVALPVIKGEKWVATKWFRDRPYLRSQVVHPSTK